MQHRIQFAWKLNNITQTAAGQTISVAEWHISFSAQHWRERKNVVLDVKVKMHWF
jgi:hypothetical protein